jgi:hypothetical protein
MTTDLKPVYIKFHSQVDCLTYLEKLRWENNPVCPKCGYSKFSPIKNKHAYHCNMCNRTFTVTTQTIFHKSKLDLQKWFLAIHLVLKPNEIITARDLGNKIGVTKDTAWAIQNKVKSALISSPQLILKLDDNLNQIIWKKIK